jgi:Uncharacterized MobA-related protein
MITAIILAAGQSTRMGSPKMLLPWGKTTVIEHVITVFEKAGIDDILVVTGGAHEQVENIIEASRKRHSVRTVYNTNYARGEMLSSIQCGLVNTQGTSSNAVLIGLGDQPQVEDGSVRLLKEAYARSKRPLIVPSYDLQRGHPWLVARPLWMELLSLKQDQTPRDFMNAHAQEIMYVNVDTPSILADLDTPTDYQKAQYS